MMSGSLTKGDLLAKMKDLDNVTSALTGLKQDIIKKKDLLAKMENALKESESRLEKKVCEIDEKNDRLNDVENKLLKRQEELEIQEKEVQTNAILEFLTFQAREMEIQERAKAAPDPSQESIKDKKIDELLKRLEEKEREIIDARSNASSIEISGNAPEELQKSMEEVNRLRMNLDDLKFKLDSKERALIQREDELLAREKRTTGSLSDEDKNVLEAISEREKELKNLEETIRAKQKEINRFMEGIQIKDDRIKELENEVRMKSDLLELKEQEPSNFAGDPKDVKQLKEVLEKEYQTRVDMIEDNYKTKMKSLENNMDSLKTRNEELEVMGDQLSAEKLRVTLLERELKERMNEISFSEERLSRRQELMLKERKQLDEKMKSMKESADGSTVSELNEELANRQKQLRDIEKTLREKEEYLRKREKELERMRSSILDDEMKIEMMDEHEEDLTRIRTGVRRFDDLTYGGFQPNSNYILFGPAYSGRRTFTNLFIAEGLKKGIPAIYVITQSTPNEVKDSLRTVIPKVDAYEDKGLIRFIDIYSKSMGIEEEYPNTIYIDKPTNLDAIESAIGEIQEDFKGKYKYHKMVFFSVSTLLTYIEPLSIFRFFQVLNAKNKRNNCVSIYAVDTGMHKQSDIQTLKHTMNGFIEFKLDDLKYYLRVEGGGDVMSRAWIEYSFTDKTLDLRGSFSLDHIR